MNLVRLPADEIKVQFASDSRAGGSEAGILGIRPEDFWMSSDTPAGGIALDLSVEAFERVGAETFITVPASMRCRALPPISRNCRPARGSGAVAPREKLHLFGTDGRKRLER
jgi:sn-glycerol 3-phosphate transport system ATP-binding protein